MNGWGAGVAYISAGVSSEKYNHNNIIFVASWLRGFV
jgi:hypothetical protein